MESAGIVVHCQQGVTPGPFLKMLAVDCLATKKKPLCLALILWVATLLPFLPALQYGYINLDDPKYVIDNPNIHALTLKNVETLFSSYFEGHYHPLTLLSLAVDYQLGGSDPWVFHLVNILLHSLSACLLFLTIYRKK